MASAQTPRPARRTEAPTIALIVGTIVVALLVGFALIRLAGRANDTPAGDDAAAGPAADSPEGAGAPDGGAGGQSAPGGGATDSAAADQAGAAPDLGGAPDDAGNDVQTVSVFELQVGDCYLSPEPVGEVTTVDVVPCDTPHDDEVFHVLTYPESAPGYPGREALLAFGNRECTDTPFAAFVGVTYTESGYFTGVQAPSEDSWEDGDRSVLCVLYDPQGQLARSARGTAR